MTTTGARTTGPRGRWLALLAGLTLTLATLSAAPTGAVPPPKPPGPGTITTVAGGLGDHKQATTASLWGLSQVALDPAGENLYITTGSGQNRLRRLELATGIITTMAGTGFLGVDGSYPLGDGGPATQAGLAKPFGVTVDPAGNLYIADHANNRVRRVDAPQGKKGRGGGTITTVAGGNGPAFGVGDFCGDGGPATAACLSKPTDVAIDHQGNLYIADGETQRIRRIDAVTGVITTVAGGGGPTGLASHDRTWYKPAYCGDGGPATQACLAFPMDVELDQAGNLYIAEQGNSRVRRVDAATGIITTVAGIGVYGKPEGHLYCGDGGPATRACLNQPHGLAFDPHGNLFIADTVNGRVRRIDAATGVITTVAGVGAGTAVTGAPVPLRGSDGRWLGVGDGGPATLAALQLPIGVAVDPAGNLYISDGGTVLVRRVDAATGLITTVAGNGHLGFSGDGGPALLAEMGMLAGGAVGPDGDLYVADTNAQRIRRLDLRHGVIDTVAGSSSVAGYGGDGGRATQARLTWPYGVAFDPGGNLYIADTGNCLVRQVDADTGIITTVAGVPPAQNTSGPPLIGSSLNCGTSPDGEAASTAKLGKVTDVAFGPGGDLYLADGSNCLVRKIDLASGVISTVAGGNTSNRACGYSGDGGPATQAQLSFVTGVAVDQAGDVYIADSGLFGGPRNNRVRKVDAETGIITTIAGTGRISAGFGFYSGDGGPATEADLNLPSKVAVDAAGNLFIADFYNFRVRKVDAVTGIITTVVGNGSWNYCGDGGAATHACLSHPNGLALDPATGDVYIADTGGAAGPGGFSKAPDRIRKVAGLGATG